MRPEEEPALFFWTPPHYASNFGDALSSLIVERILKKAPLRWTRGQKPRLLAVGSILHFARDGDIVWGSGVLRQRYRHNFKKLDIRAVRGPLTRDLLIHTFQIPCPEIYGDPALLLSLLFPELKPNPQREFIVIPNLNEIDAYKELPNLVLPIEDCREVLGKILEAKRVYSGSLHGIIAAESFGIPAILLRLTEAQSLFKYQDYYEGTGRKEFPIAYSLEEAFQMEPPPPPRCDLKSLLESFPFDKFPGR